MARAASRASASSSLDTMIAAQRTVRADHPVARDQHRDIVGAIGRSRGAHRGGLADGGGDLGVATRLAGRDAA
jgi:hypothetical protein